METLKSYLEQHLSVSNADWQLVNDTFCEGSSEKNSILSASNKVENRLYFLLNGVVRLFYEAENKDITLNFGFPGNFICSYTSFLTQSESQFVLQAITPCRYLYISKSDLESLYELTRCGQELGRILTEHMFLYLSNRENSFMLQSSTQRYLDLFEKQPQLIQEIPQKFLASYIGITPQALSRIRAKLAEQD